MIEIRPDKKNKQVFIDIADAPNKVRKGLREALTEIGQENKRHTKLIIIRPPKTGRLYRIKGIRHQASAVGEPPANLSGKLVKSIGYRVYSWERMEFGDKVPYGKYLEDGTKNMGPRPHLKATVDAKQRDNFNTIVTAVDRKIKKKR